MCQPLCCSGIFKMILIGSGAGQGTAVFFIWLKGCTHHLWRTELIFVFSDSSLIKSMFVTLPASAIMTDGLIYVLAKLCIILENEASGQCNLMHNFRFVFLHLCLC